MNDSPFRLRPDQLARLLNVGARPQEAEEATDESPGKALRLGLTSRFPLGASASGLGAHGSGRATGESGRCQGRTIGEVLLDPGASLAALRGVKDCAKGLLRQSRSYASRAAATTLYYSAIAAALEYQGVKITEHSQRELCGFFGSLVQRPWVPDELKELLTNAQRTCQVRVGGANPGKET